MDDTVSLATLWRWGSARTPSGISVLAEMHLGRGTSLFAGRSDSEDGWNRLLGDIPGGPAEIFILSSVGIPEDLGVRDSGRTWTNLSAGAWIRARIGKAVSREEFEEKESGRSESSRFPFGIGILEENPGKWVICRT